MHSLLFLSALLFAARIVAAPLSETWQTGYMGTDATGAHVLGYWRFGTDKTTVDSSGKGHALTLAGAKWVTGGKHGCLLLRREIDSSCRP